jgi:hypothetical protein
MKIKGFQINQFNSLIALKTKEKTSKVKIKISKKQILKNSLNKVFLKKA